MREITLTQGKVALVDDSDYEWLSQFKWISVKCGRMFYAVRNIQVDSRQKRLWMHRVIMGALPGYLVDHKDSNGLNNQRNNLRAATKLQNNWNTRKRRAVSSSRFKGVCWFARGNRWQSYIRIQGHKVHLGVFVSEELAARAYDSSAAVNFGEFALLNFKKEVA